MAIKVSKQDVIWGYLGQFLYNGINILLLPFVLKLMPENELGLWYTFTSIGVLANLLDFGFKTTITRNIAYAWGGAAKIPKAGEKVEKNSELPNLRLLKSVMTTAKYLYLFVGIIALILLLTIGTWYIVNISHGQLVTSDYLLAWIIYIIAVFLNIYYGYWAPSLSGLGAIKENYQSMVYSKGIHLVIAVVGLLLGFKLTAVATAYLVSSIALRLISKWKFNHYKDIMENRRDLDDAEVSNTELKNTFKEMWPNAYKQGIMSLSNFFTDKCAILICSSIYGLKTSAQLGLTIQLLSVVSIIGNVLFNSLMPYIIQLKMNHSSEKSYQILTVCLGAQTFIFTIGGLIISFLANPILSFIGSNSSILPLKESIVLAMFVYVFAYQQVCCSYIIAGNEMPMYIPYIVTGLLTVIVELVISISLGHVFQIWTILLPQILLQFAYNAWKWPSYVSNQHKRKLVDLYIDSIKNIKQIFNIRSLKADKRAL